MMKRFYFNDDSGEYVVVGLACDIRHLYRRMLDRVEIIDIYPLYADFPRFNNNLFYGIMVEDGKFSIVSQDIIIDWLMNDLI